MSGIQIFRISGEDILGVTANPLRHRFERGVLGACTRLCNFL